MKTNYTRTVSQWKKQGWAPTFSFTDECLDGPSEGPKTTYTFPENSPVVSFDIQSAHSASGGYFFGDIYRPVFRNTVSKEQQDQLMMEDFVTKKADFIDLILKSLEPVDARALEEDLKYDLGVNFPAPQRAELR